MTMISSRARSEEPSLDSLPSYPITIDSNQSREFSSLAVDFANLKLRGKSITVIPISVEIGMTGAVLIGDGRYNYTPKAGKNFSGRFHAAMLRFNPNDADSIIKLSAAESAVDKGASELARAVLAATFRHCYHRGQEALIPPEGAIAADLFSRELGDVLISADGKTAVVYSFTDRKMLYEKK
jgi:hypothetical protein